MLHMLVQSGEKTNKVRPNCHRAEIRKAKYASYPDLWELGGHLGLLSVLCQRKWVKSNTLKLL